MTTYYSGTPKAYVAVDCIIFGFDNNKLKLMLGKRQMDPGRGEWSLYGGFVGMHESVDEAAHRVLYELTGLKNLYMRQVGAFGAVNRDPGERVVSIAYCALIKISDYDHQLYEEHAAEWVDLDHLPPLYSDHQQMVLKAISLLRKSIKTEPITNSLLPDYFTLTQLQHVYEAILGESIDKRNFRKRIMSIDLVEKTEMIDKITSKRGAALYRFNNNRYEGVRL